MSAVGFVGLGNMGAALAANLVAAGHDVVANDIAGPDRTPPGAAFVADLVELARRVDVVVLSLPDGVACEQVAGGIATAAGSDGSVRQVVDTSTIGVDAARWIDRRLAEAGIGYVDAPVSGGVAGARARTLSVMYAGADGPCAAVEPVLAGLSDRRRRVGDRAGMGQALKLANNFLSATALAATSEAVAFGVAHGLDAATMVSVLNESSGRSGATEDKFPDHVLTGRYASGFTSSLMAKDVGLYLDAADRTGSPVAVGTVTAAIWKAFAEDEPGADFTRIYPHVSEPSDALGRG